MAPHATTDSVRDATEPKPNGTKASSSTISLPIDYPVSNLKLDRGHCIDDVRPLRVAVIGAGLSGITAGILLPAKVPRIQLTIFEKNDDVVRWNDSRYFEICN